MLSTEHFRALRLSSCNVSPLANGCKLGLGYANRASTGNDGMELYELTDDLMVGGQIGPDTIPLIAAQGIRAIICNRFDGEAPDQPPFSSVEQAAAAHGIVAVSQPVLQPPAHISGEEAAAFGKLLEELPKPVLAYCRSGTRCTVLWALSQAPKQPFNEIVLQAMHAGYDLTRLVPRLRNLFRP